MRLRRVFCIVVVVLLGALLLLLDDAQAQNPDPLFELPVQLIGFPVIVLSVRLSQFAKKLAYSLNPNTYRGRSKRDAAASLAHDLELAQKAIVREFGPKACIMEEPCRMHASRPSAERAQGLATVPWHDTMLRKLKAQPDAGKQWYLLSVFIGDATRNLPLCRHLAKRLPCIGNTSSGSTNRAGPLPPPQPR